MYEPLCSVLGVVLGIEGGFVSIDCCVLKALLGRTLSGKIAALCCEERNERSVSCVW